MHHELVLIDQSQLRQRQWELHTSHEQSLARLPLELLNGLAQIPAYEFLVSIDLLQGARHDVLLCRVDRLGEGFHPIRSRSRRRRRERDLIGWNPSPRRSTRQRSTSCRAPWSRSIETRNSY